nr:putative cell division cycle ATPase [Ipomoea batatas]
MEANAVVSLAVDKAKDDAAICYPPLPQRLPCDSTIAVDEEAFPADEEAFLADDKEKNSSQTQNGSQITDLYDKTGEVDEGFSLLFPYNIEIRPPEDETHLISWKAQLENDIKMIHFMDNKNHIAEVLAANDLEWIQNIEMEGLLSHPRGIFQDEKTGSRDTLKLETNSESSKPVEGGDGIGSKLEAKSENPVSDSKTGIEKSVPLVKNDGENTAAPRAPPCRGILLFGCPGTRKTMLAKVISNEAGASFINVSMSTITSKWFGEDEKNVRALFTLAAKISPTIIFVDEIDSMLGQRTRVGEHEDMQKIKNEFMTHWDGLLTKFGERILVLAATDKPFDLDEAIIRRFECGYIYIAKRRCVSSAFCF